MRLSSWKINRVVAQFITSHNIYIVKYNGELIQLKRTVYSAWEKKIKKFKIPIPGVRLKTPKLKSSKNKLVYENKKISNRRKFYFKIHKWWTYVVYFLATNKRNVLRSNWTIYKQESDILKAFLSRSTLLHPLRVV